MDPMHITKAGQPVKRIISEGDPKPPAEAPTLNCDDAELALKAMASSSAEVRGSYSRQDEHALGLVYGNSAKLLDKDKQIIKNGTRYTHEWTFYVKAYNDGWDMPTVLREVVFVTDPVHPSTRLTKPPYEVTHTGWGEYPASIRLHFKAPFSTKKTLILYHTITLVRTEPEECLDASGNDRLEYYTVVPFIRTEHYDELIVPSVTQEQRNAIRRATRKNATVDPACQHERARRECTAAMDHAKKMVMAAIAKKRRQILTNIDECKRLRSLLAEESITTNS